MTTCKTQVQSQGSAIGSGEKVVPKSRRGGLSGRRGERRGWPPLPLRERQTHRNARQTMNRQTRSGRVCLVGAGPGDPELLTLKGVNRLRCADVVLHDSLVSSKVLALVPPRARVLNVGKRCGSKCITQQEINSLLMSFAASVRAATASRVIIVDVWSVDVWSLALH
jgi:Tetrapyrrole (Corrin/Porphyrin) Methylases